jgi:hypothetical protein
MYPWITKDIQESFHTLKKSKTVETLNPIKSDNKDLHESTVVLHRWDFILNLSWEFSYTWLWKIKPKLKGRKYEFRFWSPASFFLRLNSLFIGSKQTLEALKIPEKSYFNLLVKLGSNPSTNRNRIRPNLRSYISGHF